MRVQHKAMYNKFLAREMTILLFKGRKVMMLFDNCGMVVAYDVLMTSGHHGMLNKYGLFKTI